MLPVSFHCRKDSALQTRDNRHLFMIFDFDAEKKHKCFVQYNNLMFCSYLQFQGSLMKDPIKTLELL